MLLQRLQHPEIEGRAADASAREADAREIARPSFPGRYAGRDESPLVNVGVFRGNDTIEVIGDAEIELVALIITLVRTRNNAFLAIGHGSSSDDRRLDS